MKLKIIFACLWLATVCSGPSPVYTQNSEVEPEAQEIDKLTMVGDYLDHLSEFAETVIAIGKAKGKVGDVAESLNQATYKLAEVNDQYAAIVTEAFSSCFQGYEKSTVKKSIKKKLLRAFNLMKKAEKHGLAMDRKYSSLKDPNGEYMNASMNLTNEALRTAAVFDNIEKNCGE